MNCKIFSLSFKFHTEFLFHLRSLSISDLFSHFQATSLLGLARHPCGLIRNYRFSHQMSLFYVWMIFLFLNSLAKKALGAKL